MKRIGWILMSIMVLGFVFTTELKPGRRQFLRTIGKVGVVSVADAKESARLFLKRLQQKRYSFEKGV